MENSELITILRQIPDPRIESRTSHRLLDILVISLCAVTSGAEDWDDIEDYATEQEVWLSEFLELPSGIPSADTFARVLSILEPAALEQALIELVRFIRKSVSLLGPFEVIALDGKTLKGSFNSATEKSAIHMVSAWSVQTGLVLGQCKVNEKTNEITAVPELLRKLHIQGTVITADALNTQKTTVNTIVAGGGEYVLALKSNHPRLHKDVEDFFNSEAQSNELEPEFQMNTFETTEKGHGRVEIRKCTSCDQLNWLEGQAEWKNLNSISKVECRRWLNGKETTDIRYYLSSLESNPENILYAVRSHWGVESLHWILDVTFQEDKSRIRTENAAENFSRIRRLALMLLKSADIQPSNRRKRKKHVSIKSKRKLCGWNVAHLITALFREPAPHLPKP